MDADTVIECLACHSVFPAVYEDGQLVLRPACPACDASANWHVGPALQWTDFDRLVLEDLFILAD